jgi:NAD+ diphosphatase
VDCDALDPAPTLPFNRDSLRGTFIPAKRVAAPPEQRGHWFLIESETLLLPDAAADLWVATGPLPEPFRGQVEPVVFLGTYDGEACWVAAVPPGTAAPAGFRKETLVPRNTRLTGDVLSLGGIALQALHWERMSRHCPCCGKPAAAIEGESGRRCPDCKTEHYPSLHPAVIVLVRDGDRVLLTRKSFWPPRRYGLVAGFVDRGESLEEAVRREVREETGVEIRDIRYVASQYWPFPSQLMIGFTARYAGGELTVDHGELDDARWFTVQELPDLPPPMSIARYIIDRFGAPSRDYSRKNRE